MPKKFVSKKEQFTQEQKSKLPVLLGIIGIVLIVGVAFIALNSNDNEGDNNYFGSPVATSRSYVGELISMTTIAPTVENGQIKIPLEVVDTNNIVSFELENNENVLVPLMAYITPTGRLFAGSSMCEPCRGRTFSLAGETLVCDTCRTTYSIENHSFISGAPSCGSYPPVNLNPIVENGTIIIELEEVLNWRIRA
ncbi:putative membrane protein DUF2318 [Natranaerovirga pectinivora]|uniref:Putative membrane protein DUF2318 n=1 Tax=Natranaerovirga pectinivora TaxID=682400 RepID=A0A4R3MPF2_9FIRM|nr:Fe-S-containing protein [Natranaerovirga pectinivora]TCT16151.1 putative membrane protein DUF2318 [Natranaerovirga pectinivora]